MATYHLSVKTISRSQGRSATAAAAYRSGSEISCERYGVEHDYSRKSGVEHVQIITPDDAPGWMQDREKLWNAVEEKETRKNSVVAREWEVALPHELNAEQRREIAETFAKELVDRYGVVADVAIHAPGREGDQRNHHAHILTTTRNAGPEGLDAKTRILDAAKTGGAEIEAMREKWAEITNHALERADRTERIDHRSLETQREEAQTNARDAHDRGDEKEAAREGQRAETLDRLPEPKLGVAAAGQERRAQRRAEREGRTYQPVTERGAAVAESRAERSFVAEARERLDTARGAYTEAREEGRSRPSAAREALRSMVDQDRNRAAREALKSMVDQDRNRATRKELERMREEERRREADPAKQGSNRVKLEADPDKRDTTRLKPLIVERPKHLDRDRDDGIDR